MPSPSVNVSDPFFACQRLPVCGVAQLLFVDWSTPDIEILNPDAVGRPLDRWMVVSAVGGRAERNA